MLGVTHHFVNGMDIHVRFCNDEELIVSPSRKKRRSGLRSSSLKVTSTPKTPRSRLGTSILESPGIQDSPKLNDSVLSGYDGDKEDDLDDSIIRDGKLIFLSFSVFDLNFSLIKDKIMEITQK